MTTVTYPAGVTNSGSSRSTQYDVSAVLAASILTARKSAAEPDFAPVATVARGIIDNAGNLVDTGHGSRNAKARGQIPIANGTQDFTLTGLGLHFIPVGGTLSVVHASSGKTEIRAWFIGLPTADGFVARFNAAVGDGTYILVFELY